jgi:hypothetical protein
MLKTNKLSTFYGIIAIMKIKYKVALLPLLIPKESRFRLSFFVQNIQIGFVGSSRRLKSAHVRRPPTQNTLALKLVLYSPLNENGLDSLATPQFIFGVSPIINISIPPLLMSKWLRKFLSVNSPFQVND